VDKGGKLVMQQPLVMDDTSLTRTRDFRWAANRDEKRHQATDHKMESCAAIRSSQVQNVRTLKYQKYRGTRLDGLLS